MASSGQAGEPVQASCRPAQIDAMQSSPAAMESRPRAREGQAVAEALRSSRSPGGSASVSAVAGAAEGRRREVEDEKGEGACCASDPRSCATPHQAG